MCWRKCSCQDWKQIFKIFKNALACHKAWFWLTCLWWQLRCCSGLI